MKNLVALFTLLLVGVGLFAQETRLNDIYINDTNLEHAVEADSNVEPIMVRELIAFPNPFNESLTLMTIESGMINILTMNGELVKQFEVNGVTNKIDVRDIEEGFYLIKLKTENSVYTVRVLKTNE